MVTAVSISSRSSYLVGDHGGRQVCRCDQEVRCCFCFCSESHVFLPWCGRFCRMFHFWFVRKEESLYELRSVGVVGPGGAVLLTARRRGCFGFGGRSFGLFAARARSLRSPRRARRQCIQLTETTADLGLRAPLVRLGLAWGEEKGTLDEFALSDCSPSRRPPGRLRLHWRSASS